MWIYIFLLLPVLYIIKTRILQRRQHTPSGPPPIVTTVSGSVEGCWRYSGSGTRQFASFMGIPYAAPPIGTKRFLRPEPVKSWSGVKKCTKSVEFSQRNVFRAGSPRSGVEDSLVLNVYTPSVDPADPLPVMVFIHGGGFVTGSSSNALYGPEHFMDKDIVLVAINYRLSVLGSLYLGEKSPGNQGMRDQVLALQWVQENIGHFGGDKERVTIFGESAGGMSVMNLFLSPMSRGLFSAAISMSGSPLSVFVGNDKHPEYYGRKLAQRFGCSEDQSEDEVLEVLQGLEDDELQSCAYFLEEFIRAPMPFKPYVDGGLVDDPLLPEEPLEMLKKGDFAKVPLMLGTNQNEGILIKAFYDRQPAKYLEAYNNWENIGPLALFHREKDELSQLEIDLAMEYRDKHFSGHQFTKDGEINDILVEMYGDVMFTAPADLTARIVSDCPDAGPVYNYIYNHPGPIGLYDLVAKPTWKVLLKVLGLKVGLPMSRGGVGHADELFLMFKPHALPVDLLKADQDKRVSKKLVNMWTDFATHHNPTPGCGTWTRFQSNSPKYCEISGNAKVMMYPEKHAKRMEEWREIWTKIPPTMRHLASSTWDKMTRSEHSS